MDTSNGAIDFKSRVSLYRAYDAARQHELEEIADKYDQMRQRLEVLEADLADEKETRQSYRKRALDAENARRRVQFVLVLVDGDGYIFKDTYLRDANDSGGARAAHDLLTEIQDYLREQNLMDDSGPELQVMVNVYANRAGLAKHLSDADVIQLPAQLDQFFHSFTNSKSLFQFIDCGYGKERADAKLRGTYVGSILVNRSLTQGDAYRFYAYHVHCEHIFLACCHDNGYVAELDKYRHDSIAAPKTILVDSAQMGRDYRTLNFPIVRLSIFNTQPIVVTKKEAILPIMPTMPTMPRMPSLPNVDEIVNQANIDTTSNMVPSTWSSLAASNNAGASPATAAKKPIKSAPPPPATLPSPQPEYAEPNITHTKGIPVNRLGQRIDLKMVLPTSADLDAFEDRIATRKLCNKHHLGNECYTYNCRYDHDPIDAKLKNTLRYKARSIPCQNGTQCRDPDCYYGHQCPWGRDKCTNPKCAFVQRGMHNVADTDVAKYVPAEA